jgi:hypothetical protein
VFPSKVYTYSEKVFFYGTLLSVLALTERDYWNNPEPFFCRKIHLNIAFFCAPDVAVNVRSGKKYHADI